MSLDKVVAVTGASSGIGEAIDINIRGVLHGIAAVLPSMSDRDSGHIINIGSSNQMK